MFSSIPIRPAFAPPPVFAESSDCRTALESKLVKTPFFDKYRAREDNWAMRLSLGEQIAIGGFLVILSLISGWWLRSECLTARNWEGV
jgi:hypothetical protein